MMEHSKVERINELARLSKERELTPAENEEREALRKEYIQGFRENMQQVLDNVHIKQPDGTVVPLKKKEDKQ